MKKLEAVIQGCKADDVREAIATEKLPRVTIFEVKGAGTTQGRVTQYRGCRYIEESADVKIEIVTDDDEAERIAELIIATLRSGSLGDGEVIIFPIDQHFRLRVGQCGDQLPSWKQEPGTSYLERRRTSLGSYLEALRRTFRAED
jgi:nitrogen regulatory protein PII